MNNENNLNNNTNNNNPIDINIPGSNNTNNNALNVNMPNNNTTNDNTVNVNMPENNSINNDNTINVNMPDNNMNNNITNNNQSETINIDNSEIDNNTPTSINTDNNIVNTTIPDNNYSINNTVENVNTNNNISGSNKTNIFAILGLVFAFLLSLLGLIFSIIGLKKSKELGTGSGLSIAGIIISLINIIIHVLFIAMTFYITSKSVLTTIDHAKENTIGTMANMTAEWFERQYQFTKFKENEKYNEQEFINYFKYNDFTSGEKRLTQEIIDKINNINIDGIEINYDDSTVKLEDNERVCVKITATIKGNTIQKYSSACKDTE